MGVIQEQDSLLALSALSKKEQQSAIRRYLRDLQKQRDDSIFKAESGSTAKEAAYKIEQKAYILLAKAYVDQLQDYTEALNALDTLDKRFPAHSQKEEELYLRYRIAVKQNKLDKAQGYANELLTKYPRSQYASLLKPRQSEARPGESTSEVAAYFDQTYSQLMKHQYTEVLMRVEEAQKKYEDPVYHKRFEIVEAMAYAGTGNYNMADSLTSKFIKTNPGDTLVDWAKAKAIAGFNAEKFAPMGLEVVIDMFDMSQSVMIVRNFGNAATAKAYMDELAKVSLFTGYAPGEVKTFIISSRNYTKMFADKTTGNYPSFYSANYAQ
eukprot:gene34368-biopygen11700